MFFGVVILYLYVFTVFRKPFFIAASGGILGSHAERNESQLHVPGALDGYLARARLVARRLGNSHVG